MTYLPAKWWRYLEWALHLLLLLLYFGSLNVAWDQDWLVMAGRRKLVHPVAALAFPLAFYLNALWLIPQYLQPRRWLAYGIGVLLVILGLEIGRSALFAGMASGSNAWSGSFREELFRFGIFGVQESVLLGFLASWAYRFTWGWLRNLGQIERLKAEKNAVELAFLKSQVDPHFLFNTLNSLYALALEENGERTADSIAKLGGLMRYSLHDARAERIVLAKELDYIRSYIELQELRLSERNQVKLHIAGGAEERRELTIAPLLLIPFIENAFKYGVSPREESRIEIHLAIVENTLYMDVKNTIVRVASEKGGLGLKNVRNRLALLYPERHRLEWGPAEGQYFVHLEIDLSV